MSRHGEEALINFIGYTLGYGFLALLAFAGVWATAHIWKWVWLGVW